MKPADIGFILHQDNWISRVMAWVMGSQWSHSFIVIDTGTLDRYICETTDFEVTVSPFGRKYMMDPYVNMEIWSPIDMSEGERVQVSRGSVEQVGTIYGYLQLVSFAIKRFLKRFGYNIPNFLRQGMVCDHVVLYGYTQSSIPGLQGIDPESIDTEDLYQLVKQSGRFELKFKVDGPGGKRA